jgi:phytoene dehydrogenase-like protein
MNDRYPVGIVGGGAAGLTCAYYLALEGIPSIVFERESRLGGRLDAVREGGEVLELGAKVFTRACVNLCDLVEHLGLTSQLVHLTGAQRVGIHTPAGQIRCTASDIDAQGILTSRERAAAAWYLLRYVTPIKRPSSGDSPSVIHERSCAEDVLQECGERVLTQFFVPLTQAFAFATPDKLSALAVRLFLQLYLSPFLQLRGGFPSLIARLAEAVPPLGHIETGAEVISALPNGAGFTLMVRQGGRTSTVQVERLVCALPLPQAEPLLRTAGLANWHPPYPYRQVYQTLVRGTLRPKFMDNHYNLVLSDALPQGAMTTRLGKEAFSLVCPTSVSPEALMSVFCSPGAEIIPVAQQWQTALRYVPLMPPRAQLPGPLTAVPSLFICGDYYYMLGLESTILTAREVSRLVTESLAISGSAGHTTRDHEVTGRR